MGRHEISTLLNKFIRIKFCERKWVVVDDFSSGQYSGSEKRRFKTSMLNDLNLCDFSDAYIVV